MLLVFFVVVVAWNNSFVADGEGGWVVHIHENFVIFYILALNA